MSEDAMPTNLQQKLAILNCSVTFSCKKLWAELAPTGNASVRTCADCRQNVFRCQSPDQLKRHIAAGHCVAIVMDDDESKMFVGQMKDVYQARAKLVW